MKTMTATQKIKKWAALGKSRNIGHAAYETCQTEKAFMFMVARLRRKGILTYERKGQSIQLLCTDYNTTIQYI